MGPSADLVEIFSSIQGEGPSVGEPTLFVRFGGCDLRCRWCDSPHTWRPPGRCRFELEPGGERFREVDNPVEVATVLEAARALEVGTHRFVSLTGGEPLLQPEAVGALASALRQEGPRILLETHGLATEALEQVISHVDVVSMDWKLASEVRRADAPRGAPGEPFHEWHQAFLRVARRAPEVVVKVVVTPSSECGELDAMASAIAAVDASTPVILQPVTPFGPVREAPTAASLLSLVRRLRERLSSVRLIPQTHKQLGVL